MEETEKKIWVIGRVDQVFRTFENLLESENCEFLDFMKQETSRINNFGKGTFAAIGFFISLIIGLNSINIKIVSAEVSVSLVLFGGSILYVSALIVANRNNKILTDVEKSGRISRGDIYFVEGYVIRISMNTDLYSADDYVKFMEYFVNCIVPSLNLAPFYTIQKYINSPYLSEPTRGYLKHAMESWKKSLDKALDDYEKNREDYESNDFLEPLLVYAQSLQDYKNGKQTLPLHLGT